MQSVLPIVQTVADHLVPEPFKLCLRSSLNYLLYPSRSNILIAKIEEYDGIQKNEVFDAAQSYLRDKINPSTKCFKVHKTHRQKELSFSIDNDIAITDKYEELDVTWTLRKITRKINEDEIEVDEIERYFFELSFHKKFYHRVRDNYLPSIVDKVRHIRNTEKKVSLFCGGYDSRSIYMDHPATFDTLVMDLDMKQELIDDLETFTKRKDYYRRTGRAWKRGYLLYGPPGTGKSSLVAAMANHLKYDVHELDLTRLNNNTDFRQTLLSTGNGSIIVIEDIDCSAEEVQVLNRRQPTTRSSWTLSGLLNFLDGLWSSCGDERIFVFTTNHKDRLDPALLRPGRIDMQIHMSYCTKDGFKSLARNYLEVKRSDYRGLLEEIEDLITKVNVTPAEVSGELMRSQNVDTVLRGLVNFLKRKNENPIHTATQVEEEEESTGSESQQSKKRRKTETIEFFI